MTNQKEKCEGFKISVQMMLMVNNKTVYEETTRKKKSYSDT